MALSPTLEPASRASSAWPTTRAQAGAPARVEVLKVTGLVDPVVADDIVHTLSRGAQGGADLVVLQVDSRGGVVSRSRADELAFRVAHSGVPVASWVGQSGARALGTAFQLVRASAVSGIAPGSRVGRAPPPVIGGPNPVAHRTVGPAAARRLGLVDLTAPTLGDFIVGLDGRQVAGRTLHTAVVVREGGQLRRRPTVDVRFSQLGLVARVLHTAASPSAAYFLLVAGMALVVLELYTAGVGIAAIPGAGFIVLASYGLAVLPARPLAIALLVVGVAGYAVDVQTGAPRVWTGIGTVSLAAGSVSLYDGGLRASPVVIVLVVAGVAVFMVAGIPSLVRARFSTPTIGREGMVGELGNALGDLAPEGTVEVRGALWRARTNRATPIGAGRPVRVVAIDGLVLEVEPETGGARDVRQ